MNIRSGTLCLVALPALFVLGSCSSEPPLSPSQSEIRAESTAAAPSAFDAGSTYAMSTGPNERACWGQATKVFARMGKMGEHASEQPNPRIGLRNLARALFDMGIIADDSMQALGEFVAAELGLSIEACM